MKKIITFVVLVSLGGGVYFLLKKPAESIEYRFRKLQGIPELRTMDEAVAFVMKEDSLLHLKIVQGSQHGPITLPSGLKITNWEVECLFPDVFCPFGTKAIPVLIDMLDHKYEYARYGADYTLVAISGRKDSRYHYYASSEQRQTAIRAWKDWWKQNERNPRLNESPKRVYEAADWENQHIN